MFIPNFGERIQFGEHIFKMDSYCQGYITKDSYTVLVEVLGMWFKPGIQPPLSFFKINPQNPPRVSGNPSPPTLTVQDVCPRFLGGNSGRSSMNHICTMIKSMTFWNPTFRTPFGSKVRVQRVRFVGDDVLLPQLYGDYFIKHEIQISIKQPVFSRYFWRKWGSFGGGKIQNFDVTVKGENYWEEKKLGDILPSDKHWKKNIESFLEGIFFVWSRSSLVFWLPLAKKHR